MTTNSEGVGEPDKVGLGIGRVTYRCGSAVLTATYDRGVVTVEGSLDPRDPSHQRDMHVVRVAAARWLGQRQSAYLCELSPDEPADDRTDAVDYAIGARNT
jgi:hypothetical protein